MRYLLLIMIMAASLLSDSSCAHGADLAITGTKLILKPGKVVLVAKDAAISSAGVNPIHGPDSSVSFDDGSGPVTFAMPATLWSANSSGTTFKFKNASAPNAASAVKVSKVKDGMFKVVAETLPFPTPGGMVTVGVVVSFGGAQTYHLTFVQPPGGGKFFEVSPTPTPSPASTGTTTATRTFMATQTLTPSVTVTPTATPTNTPGPPATMLPCLGQQVGGSCWYLGAPGESCDLVCSDVGRICSSATRNFAGFPTGTLQQCGAVLAAFAQPFPQDIDYAGSGVGCGSGEAPYRDVSAPTTCGASVEGFSRACACL